MSMDAVFWKSFPVDGLLMPWVVILMALQTKNQCARFAFVRSTTTIHLAKMTRDFVANGSESHRRFDQGEWEILL
jgi:hypothetical protein